MKKSIRYAPPNLSFFLEDAIGGTSPEIDDREVRIWANDTTVILGCLPHMDGDTHLTVSTSLTDKRHEAPRYTGVIRSPSRILQITTSGLEVLMEFNVPNEMTRVEVWTNDSMWPDNIVVILQ